MKGVVENKERYLEDQRRMKYLPNKKTHSATARISASRMMQLMSCAIPFSKEWIYVHLANQYMNLERESLSLLYSKAFAANVFSLLPNNGKLYGMVKHGLETKWPISGVFHCTLGKEMLDYVRPSCFM